MSTCNSSKKRTLSEIETTTTNNEPKSIKTDDISQSSLKRRKLSKTNENKNSDQSKSISNSLEKSNNGIFNNKNETGDKTNVESSDVVNKQISNTKEIQSTITSSDDKSENKELQLNSKISKIEINPSSETSKTEISTNSETSKTEKSDVKNTILNFSFSMIGDSKKNDNNNNVWTNAWTNTNTNADGTFKLTYDWGNFDTKIGYGTINKNYNSSTLNHFNTEPVAVLQGNALQTGDETDNTVYCCKCKIFTLEHKESGNANNYKEKGVGMVNVNTYIINTKDTANSADTNPSSIRGRLLARRDFVMSTILNVQIFKSIKYECLENKFLRFSQFINGCEGKCITYLIKPVDRKQMKELFEAVINVQKKL